MCVYIYLIVGEGDLNADVFVENTRRCQLRYKAQHQYLQGKQSNNLMYKNILSHQKKKLMKVLEVQIVKFLPGRTITDSSLANFIQKSTSSIMPSSSGRFSFTCYQKGEKKTLQMFMLKHKSHSLYIRPYHCNHGPIWFVWTGQTRDFLNSII